MSNTVSDKKKIFLHGKYASVNIRQSEIEQEWLFFFPVLAKEIVCAFV